MKMASIETITMRITQVQLKIHFFYRSRSSNWFFDEAVLKSSVKCLSSNILVEDGIQGSPGLYQRKLQNRKHGTNWRSIFCLEAVGVTDCSFSCLSHIDGSNC